MHRARPVIPAFALLFAACGAPADEEPPEPSAADTVAMAMAAYDPAAFDTITWEAPGDAIVRGSVVFQYSCAKCHGPQGYGDAGFVAAGDTLRPPSFHTEGWKFADDLDGLRRHVFAGTETGMPHWGLEGLKYRDIDAVGRFIQDRLTSR